MNRTERKIDREIKARDLTNLMKAEAQKKYVKWVSKEEKIDYDSALKICEGRTDPINWNYTLGYKMSHPVYMIAMNLQRKDNRAKAIENFKKELTPEETAIFEAEVETDGMRARFKRKLKKETQTT